MGPAVFGILAVIDILLGTLGAAGTIPKWVVALFIIGLALSLLGDDS